MKIRTRLRLSYIIMLLVPVMLIILTGALFREHYESGDVRVEFPSEFLSKIYLSMAGTPKDFLSVEYLGEIARLSEFEAVNIKVLSGGSEAAEYSSSRMHSGSRRFASSWDFYFSDGTSGTVTVFVHEMSLMSGFMRQGGLVFLVIIGVLIFTNGILSWIVAGSIIRPLNLLKESAFRIKDEDLDSPVIYAGDDEFQDVCRAFEEMRVRLKNSLHDQIKVEENRKELLASISHDLKTPITTIKGYIEGLRDGIADSPEKVAKYISTVHSKAMLMNELIDRLFLFSKLDLNRVQFNFQSINLGPFLSDLCAEMKFNYPELDITLKVASGVSVVADRMHLHRVVSNLIDNAVKYRAGDYPVVEITVKYSDGFVVVRVKDNGRGIASGDLSRIFDRFFRSDPARSSEVEGSGLGLAISRQIITAHGGLIQAESKAGEGTVITFTLRAAE